ncbi:MAG: ABC transporter ATP-binding protein [Propionibacteriaceae bacterium]|jgi:energy-coupling factor transport system ATP-binding protein|nr:ABC transporter ATP-binding protein [Propionibacteriaceae bacterium]
MITLDGVTFAYGQAAEPSLAGVELAIPPGQCVVVCGASGSGKSTLLRLLNGQAPHFFAGDLKGAVRVAGLDTAETTLDQLGRRVGSVLQHPRRQFFCDRVEAELAFAMENFAFDPAVIRARTAELAGRFDLAGLAGRRLGQLSGGQQQRVACAAAIAHRPDVVLFDEPTSNLSAAAIADLADRLAGLKRDGFTVVVAEHRLHAFDAVADRIVVLAGGRVVQDLAAAEFGRLDDAALAAQGLRTRQPAACLAPPAAASGPSVAPNPAAGAAPSAAERPPAGLSPFAAAQDDGASGLVLRDVRVRFGGRTVLALDHAVFPAGLVTAARGPNGAGKTTLARVVTGLQRHGGSVALNGQTLSRGQRQRQAAIVMQDVQRQLFTDTVAGELALGLEVGEAAAAGLLTALGLDQLGDRHPLSLSGGQQQRLVVAVARLSGRAIVVFDEPSSGVDRRHLESIARSIRQVAAAGAVTLVISHDEDLLALAADRVLDLALL